MERPSHRISTLSLQPGSRRFAGAGLAVMAQLAFIAVLVGGAVIGVAVHTPSPLEVTNVKKIEPRTPPPSLPRVAPPQSPSAVAPLIDIAPPAGGGAITTVTPQVAPNPPVATRQAPPVATVPDRAASAIAATHTTPPYPSLARRLGAEGKVTLRLTVAPDGTVNKAEVVTSSGRADLDQTAGQWIMQHWAYRPAIRDGVPVSAQVMAAVQFSLTGQ